MNTLESLKAAATLSERLLIDRAVALVLEAEPQELQNRAGNYLFRVQQALIQYAEKYGQSGVFAEEGPFAEFFEGLRRVIAEVKP